MSEPEAGRIPCGDRAATPAEPSPAVSGIAGIPCAWPTFNLNREVAVKLTPVGLRIMEERHNELLAIAPSIGPFRPPQTDGDGWTKFQLWSLMQEFAGHICMGIPVPFETTIALDASAIEARKRTDPEEGLDP